MRAPISSRAGAQPGLEQAPDIPGKQMLRHTFTHSLQGFHFRNQRLRIEEHGLQTDASLRGELVVRIESEKRLGGGQRRTQVPAPLVQPGQIEQRLRDLLLDGHQLGFGLFESAQLRERFAQPVPCLRPRIDPQALAETRLGFSVAPLAVSRLSRKVKHTARSRQKLSQLSGERRGFRRAVGAQIELELQAARFATERILFLQARQDGTRVVQAPVAQRLPQVMLQDVGHYGSGKSHFLAYVAQQLESGSLATHRPAVVPISLLNFAGSRPLDTIVHEALGLVQADADRRRSWQRIAGAHPDGIVLLIDELSESLRSKPEIRSFNEDLRYLQFLGEWAQEHRLWVIAALQEQIEHTGDIEYDLYRKIKDRYPVRFLLTPAHVRDLVSHRILRKKESFGAAVERRGRDLKGLYPVIVPLQAEMCALYPLHPATMEPLEEVRDRFSQARGIADFTVARMLGDDARGFPPFLDMPWGAFITPDRIVDHFADLFEDQPEFPAIAQKFLPYYRKRVAELFDKPPQQELAWRLLKLLILVHLSPRRKWLTAEQACQWLLLKISRLDPEENREIVAYILDEFVQKGAYLKRQAARYRLDLEDAGRQDLDWLLARAIEEVRGRGDSLFESLVPCLDDAEFDPFWLPRDRWHARRIRWHFHERELSLYLGGGAPPRAANAGLADRPPLGTAGRSRRRRSEPRCRNGRSRRRALPRCRPTRRPQAFTAASWKAGSTRNSTRSTPSTRSPASAGSPSGNC